jgi:hypothetical protein
MVFTHHIAGDTRAFHMLLVPVNAQLRHAEQDAPVHWLQAIAHIWKRTRHDHAHRVIEIAPLHFIDDGNRLDARRIRAAIARIGQITQFISAG